MERHNKCKEDIIRKTLKEFEKGKLKQSDGKIIKNRKQALAIGLSRGDEECEYTKKGYNELEQKVEDFFNERIKDKIRLTNIIDTRKIIEYNYSKKNYKKCLKYEVMLYHYIILAVSKGLEISENVWKELKAIKKLDYKRY